MRSVTTYIHFDGNCREAMQFYQKCLGAEIQLTPHPDSSGKQSSDPAAKIMHSQLLWNGQPFLMASDGIRAAFTKPETTFPFRRIANRLRKSIDYSPRLARTGM